MLHGTVNPGGSAEAGYSFSYNTGGVCEGEGSHTTTPVAIATRNNEAVESEATGLTPKTTYTFCLVASNLFGPTPSVSTGSFETTAAAPTVENETASEETTTSAKVSATINPGGAETTCKVEYGTTEEYGSELPCEESVPAGIAGVPVTPIMIEDLEANTTYDYRFVATNEKGTVPGANVTFTTKPLVIPITEAPNPIGSEGATFNGKLTTGPEPVEYYFEYAEEESPGVFGAFTKTTTLEFEKEKVAVPVIPEPVTGLTPGTNYEVRLIAFPKGSSTPLAGALVPFTTLRPAPALTYKPPTVSRREATLSAEINTEDSTTNYIIEWGENAKYEGKKSGKIEAELAASTEPSKITQALSELEPGTTYHYRIVATNGTGTTEGEDATFRTAAPQPPAVESESAVQVAQTTATIVARVNPNGLQTSYALEVGTEVEENGIRRIAYTPTFGEVGEGAETLTLPLSGLLPGATYHYRVVVTNEDGKAGEETDQTFTTAGFPAVITPPALVTLVPFTMPKEVKPGPVVETRAEKYTKAVQLCQKIKSKKKRAACMKTAKKKYGPVAKKKHKKK